MKRIAILAFCLTAGLRLCAGDNPLVTLITNSIDLGGTTDRQTIMVAMTLGTDVKIKDLKVDYNQPVYVLLDNKYDQSDITGFKLLPFLTDSAPAIGIEVDLTKLRQAGTYQLNFTLTNGKNPQKIGISFIRPRAKLDAPPTIHIDMTGSEIVKQDPFVIKETAGVSIYRLPLQPPLFTGVNSDNLVIFDSPEYTVQGRNRLYARYTPNKKAIDDLPIGKTVNGTMDIYAPELGTTVTANFEITNKASTWWIFWLLLTGVLLGTFVRQYLKFKRDIDEKKLDAIDQLNKINIETANIKDEEFRGDIDALKRDLENKLNETAFINRWAAYIKELTDLTVLTATNYTQKRKDFDARAKAIKDKIAGLSFLFGDNRLSTVIKNKLQPAQDDYETGKSAMRDMDVTKAENQMKFATSAVNTFIASYSQTITRITGDDGTHLFPAVLPQLLKDEMKQRCQPIIILVQKLNAGSTDNDGLISAVGSADNIQAELEHTLGFLLVSTRSRFDAVFQDGGPDELMKKFKLSMEIWEKNIGEIIRDPQPMNPLIVDDLNNNWNSVIATSTKKQIIMGDGDGGQARSPFGFGGADFRLLNNQMVLGQFQSIDIESQDVLLQRSLQQLKISWLATTLIQSGIILMLMELVAYLFYAPNFNGTVQEKISLFVFSFGLNISLNSLGLIRDRKAGAIS